MDPFSFDSIRNVPRRTLVTARNLLPRVEVSDRYAVPLVPPPPRAGVTAHTELKAHLDSDFGDVPLVILSQGMYGIACLLHEGETVFLQELHDRLHHKVVRSLTAAQMSTEPLIVKFMRITDGETRWAAEREAKMHHYLASTVVPATKTLPAVVGTEVVPKFYYGGYLEFTGRSRQLWYVTVMSYVPGKTLMHYIRKMDSHTYAKVEKAVYSL